MLFKRRDFLKTSFGALFAASMPVLVLAESAKGEQMPDGLAVQMRVIAKGPFVSRYYRFKHNNKEGWYEYVIVVKLGDNKYEFDQFNSLQDLYNAEEFMRRLGYKVWICTDEVSEIKRLNVSIDDKKYRSNATKFGEALDAYRKKAN